MTKQEHDLETLKEKFDDFVFEMSDSVEALQEEVANFGRPELLPLDYTFESLDRVEKLYALVLEGELHSEVDDDTFATRLARYVGETLRKQVGGKWDFCKNPNDINYGKPCVSQIPKLPKAYCFYPLVVVAGYRKTLRPGWIRKRVERHDLERMRLWFAAFLGEMEKELKDLGEYVKSLGRPELLALDLSFESLDRVEHLLAIALDGKVQDPRGGTEGLMEKVTRYMGEVYRRHAGGKWELCEDPRDIDFGLPRIGFYSPSQIAENYRVHRTAGLLRSATESAGRG